MSDYNGYSLSRSFWDYSFENPHKMKPIHAAIYFFAIEHCNRLGWKKNFGFPSQMVMEAIGVKNWRTYSAGLHDLVNFGFIEMIETSKNQYSSNIIAIAENTKASTKALDKALQKHSTKHSQSTVSIDKQLNKEQLTSDNPFFETRNIIPPTPQMINEYSSWYLGQNPNRCFDGAQKFYDFYQSKGWKVGSQKMSDWQAAVRTWMKVKETQEGKKVWI